MFRLVLNIAMMSLLAGGTIGCETKAQSGALIGGAAGAGAGAIIGHQSGHAGGGALIGGAVGAIGGALVGNEMDKSDTRKERDRDRAARDYDRRQVGYDDRNHSAAQQITQRDVIHWTARGTRDDIIIDRIQRSSTVFYLTRQDERELRDEGVSPQVIRTMKDTARN
jgi:uncharacterized protein YcfJ